MSLTKATYSMIEGAPINVLDYGAVGDGVADDAAAIQAAINAASAGVKAVSIPAGTYLVGATITLPDNVCVSGYSKNATTIKLKNSANVNIFEQAPGADGVGVRISDLTVDGNDANNTNGGVYWAGATNERGPTLTLERVKITKCRPIANPPAGEYAAVLLLGNTFGIMNDVDIIDNNYAVGLWHATADWKVSGLYAGNNANQTIPSIGASSFSVIIQGGKGNMFSDCYFGGNLANGRSQIWIRGASNNHFANCIVDTSAESGLYFSELSGVTPSDITFVGGAISNSGAKTNNTYPAIRVDDGERITFSGVSFFNDTWPNKPNYVLTKAIGVAQPIFNGCTFDNSWATALGVSALDTYIEGTFTPTIVSSGAGTGTYANQTGYYTQIGDTVFVEIWINMTAHTGSGTMKIGGLPYTSRNVPGLGAGFAVGFIGGLTMPANSCISARLEPNSTEIDLYSNSTAGGSTTSTALALDVDFIIGLSGTYKV